MITHCPSCHTYFRVHAEQLAARAGQVRCGRCGQVFNANERLVEEIAPQPALGFEAKRIDVGAARSAPESELTQTADIAATVPETAIANGAAVTAVAAEMERVAQPAQPSQPSQKVVDTLHADTLSEKTTANPSRAEIGIATGASSFNFGPIAAAQPAERRWRWRWLLGALLLLLLLLVQAVYHFRSAVVLLFPQIKPYAVELCINLGCELPLPQRIELLSIDASDLQADTSNPNIMILSATIKNRAIFSQQYPLLELTLTDARDQPVVRRVLQPHDYLDKAVNIQAGFAANTESAIKVFVEASQVKAIGYRLYLFYP